MKTHAEAERPRAATAPLVALVANERAGTLDGEEVVDLAKAAQRRGRLRLAETQVVSPREVDWAARRAVASGASIIAVAGGDGTMRTVAEAVHGGDVAIAPLPCGTVNLHARRCFGSREVADILVALPRAKIVRAPAGRADGRLFLLSAAFGYPVRAARAREGLRVGGVEPTLEAITSAARSLAEAIRPAIRYRFKETGAARRATAVVVATGPVDGLVGRDVSWRRADEFEIAASDTNTLLDVAAFGVRALIDEWRDDPSVTVSHTRAVIVESEADEPWIALDGEPARAGRRTTLKFEKDAVAFATLGAR